jgi:diguanylate cyclase (GGDEF)-like protein
MAIANILRPNFGAQPTPADIGFSPALESSYVGPIGVALIASRDPAGERWAPRWLERAGLLPVLVHNAADFHVACQQHEPSVILLEASLADEDGQPLLNRLLSAGGDTPIVALCANGKETRSALDAGADDVMRRPYDWQIVARRARSMARVYSTGAELDTLRSALNEALARADGVKKSLRQASRMDAITGLPNRHKFREILSGALTGHTHSRGGQVAVFAVGLERFGVINDALGSAAGNQLLAAVGRRIQAGLADVASVPHSGMQMVTAAAGRLGGVRFGVLVTQVGSIDLGRIRDKLTEHLREPFPSAGGPVFVSAAMGAAVAPRDARTADRLLQCAESALMEAKRRGGGFCQLNAGLPSNSSRKLQLENMLRAALVQQQLTVAYQPLVDLTSGAVVGAEALLRWQHPEEGPISPGEFVPVAEDAGLMIPIGKFVLRTVCAQMRGWQDGGGPPIRVAVNIAQCQLMSGDLVGTVRDALQDHGIAPQQLELELSERGLVSREPEVIAQLEALKALGVRLSIDDFGAGDTALSYLKDLPLDTVKLDRLYVSGELSTGREQAVARGLAALGRSLELTIIGEGVETAEQADMLRSWGCDHYQGFLFAPAIPGDEFRQRYFNRPAR